LFPLSLSDAAFTWFISLPPNSIYNWSNLDQKFYDYFFTNETELKLSHLTSVKQSSSETISEYIKRFKYTRNRCYGLTTYDRDLVNLAYTSLLDIHKAKLEGQEFLDVSQVFQKALANKSRVKESENLQNLNDKVKRHVHLLKYESNKLDNCGEDVYATEITWSSKDTPHTCASLKPIHRNRQDEMKLIFDVIKYDKISDELLSIDKIRLSHAVSSIDDLNKCPYYKWHIFYSHATNDSNAFR
jgi:hypothetical protein